MLLLSSLHATILPLYLGLEMSFLAPDRRECQPLQAAAPSCNLHGRSLALCELWGMRLKANSASLPVSCLQGSCG